MNMKSKKYLVVGMIIGASSGALAFNEGYATMPSNNYSPSYLNVVEQKDKVLSLRRTAKSLKRLKRLKQFSALEKARVCVDKVYVSDSVDFKEMDLCFKE